MESFIDVITESLYLVMPRIIASIIVLLASWLLTKVLEGILRGMFKTIEEGYVARALSIAKLTIYGSALIIVATILMPEAQAFSIMLLIIGLAIIVMFADVLRNIGAEFYVRSKGFIRKGDWVEIDGEFIRVIELNTLEIIGETQRMEKVFIPYTKIINATVVNRSTPIGLSVKIRVIAPARQGIEAVREAILKSLKAVAEDLASEPTVSLSSMKGDKLEFIVETHILNYRKLSNILEEVSKRIKDAVPDAAIESS